jgi:hypothetical protein
MLMENLITKTYVIESFQPILGESIKDAKCWKTDGVGYGATKLLDPFSLTQILMLKYI